MPADKKERLIKVMLLNADPIRELPLEEILDVLTDRIMLEAMDSTDEIAIFVSQLFGCCGDQVMTLRAIGDAYGKKDFDMDRSSEAASAIRNSLLHARLGYTTRRCINCGTKSERTSYQWLWGSSGLAR